MADSPGGNAPSAHHKEDSSHDPDSDLGYESGDDDIEDERCPRGGEAEEPRSPPGGDGGRADRGGNTDPAGRDHNNDDDDDDDESDDDEDEEDDDDEDEEDDDDDGGDDEEKDWVDKYELMGGDYYWEGDNSPGRYGVALFGLNVKKPLLSLGRRTGVPLYVLEASDNCIYLWNQIEGVMYKIGGAGSASDIVEKVKAEKWEEIAFELVGSDDE